MQGNLEIAEKCCQQTKAYERLSFLYAVAGDTEKLWKMLKLAEMRGDVMSRYSNTLYLGSAAARTKVLEDSGHLSLAHVCAAAHGLQVLPLAACFPLPHQRHWLSSSYCVFSRHHSLCLPPVLVPVECTARLAV